MFFSEISNALVTHLRTVIEASTEISTTTRVFDFPIFSTDIPQQPYILVYPSDSASEDFETQTDRQSFNFSVICVYAFDPERKDAQKTFSETATQSLKKYTDFLLKNLTTQAFDTATQNFLPDDEPTTRFTFDFERGLFFSTTAVTVSRRVQTGGV